MMKHKKLTLEQADILKRVKVRLVKRAESKRWLELMRTYHYLGCKWLPGRSLCYVAEVDESWVAVRLVWRSIGVYSS